MEATFLTQGEKKRVLLKGKVVLGFWGGLPFPRIVWGLMSELEPVS